MSLRCGEQSLHVSIADDHFALMVKLMSRWKIIVHSPEDMSDVDQAELANGLWAVAFGASSIEVDAPNSHAVNQEMERLWKAAPKLTPKGWTRGDRY